MKPKHVHIDPPRFPKLQPPIEDKMLKMFKGTTNNIIVDITKIMVKQIKEK